MITEDYVSYNIAKLLKEKGFNWDCKTKKFYPEPDYDQESPNGVSAPTLQMAMKWLRKKHIVIIPEVETFYADGSVSSWEYHIWCDDNYEEGQHSFSSYEEAAEAAIRHCLENFI